MSEAFDRLKEEFLGETEETLAAFRADLVLLGSGTPAAPESALVDRAFRTAHSLKGVLGMFGLDAMARVAHSVESVLDEIREERLPADPTTIDVLLEACESLHALLARSGDAEPAAPDSVDALVARLEGRLAGALPASVSPDDPLELALAQMVNPPIAALAAANAAGDSIALVELRPEDPDFGARFVAILRALRAWGLLHSVLEPETEVFGAPSRVRFLVSGKTGIFALARAVGPHGGEVLPCDSEGVLRARAQAPIETGPAPAFPKDPPPVEATPSAPTLRVRIERVDRLLQALAGILQSKNALDEAAAGVIQSSGDRMRGTSLVQSLRSLDRQIRTLQSEVLGVRLVALGSLFPKLERVVWNSAREAEKSVKLVATGGDVEVDKEIVDGLLSPLVHVVRNAIDHGIEHEEIRRSSGKEKTGAIRLAARSEGGFALVEISDDGGGVDLEQVLKKARTCGLLERTARPSKEAILDVLFHPGFTTRDVASSLSGRGVGLDAVRESLAGLGGTAELLSNEGGTTVRLRVPVSRAILSGLVVRASGQSYVLPIACVARVVKVRPEEVENERDGEGGGESGRALPAEHLETLLGLAPSPAPRESRTGLLLTWSGRRALIFVDGVGARRDVVTQGLGIVRSSIPGISGSTELGDGRTLLLLDPAALLDLATRRAFDTVAGV